MTSEAAKRSIGDAKCRAAVGYCYGGANVLDLAREGADVAAVVSIHGVLATANPAAKGRIKAKVLVLHGAADPVVAQGASRSVRGRDGRRRRALDAANFGGVVHAYTDPHANFLPVAKWDEPATRYTKAMTDAFIHDAFEGEQANTMDLPAPSPASGRGSARGAVFRYCVGIGLENAR